MEYIDYALYFIGFALALFAWICILKYNMHMFQLNGYKNDEWRRWLSKNSATQRLLYAAIIPLAFSHFIIVARILAAIISLILIINYISFEKGATKKKLVYTYNGSFAGDHQCFDVFCGAACIDMVSAQTF